MDEICEAVGKPHVGVQDRIAVTILDGKRTVVGICQYCNLAIIAQEPVYETVLAPVRTHHTRLPRGMWQCPATNLDHMAAVYVHGGKRTYVCIDCNRTLVHYRWCDNLSGLESDVFLDEITIEEEPF